MFEKIKSMFGNESSQKQVPKKTGLFATLVRKLTGKTLDADSRKLIEELLYEADVGTEQVSIILDELGQLADGRPALDVLKEILIEKLAPYAKGELELGDTKPSVIMLVGINGAGKTTTVAKLAHYFKSQKKDILIAAGDTFRAAAIEQISVWADRLGVPLISQQHGADSASVIFDALASAKAKGADVLIADTAGRLHTKGHLLQELEKIIRVLKKQDERAPEHIWLVLDATIGQNSLEQAKVFAEHFPINGIIVTKLDGSAKAGVLLGICAHLQLPIVAIGTGEKVDDFGFFDAQKYVQDLLRSDGDS